MSKYPSTIIHHFECMCHSSDHSIRITVDPGYISNKENLHGWPPEMYLEVQLHQWHPWYKKIWIAIKYIFGYESKYGHWDCTEFKPEDVDRLQSVLTEYKIYQERWENHQLENNGDNNGK